MARFARLDVLNEITRLGVIPVFYQADLETAKNVVRACAEGGARVIEFTNRGDNAYRVFSDLVDYFAKEMPEVILGVGSVGDPGIGAVYLASGANFVVGSMLNPELARLCNRRKVAYSPGCGSATEISQAEELGVEIVKVFPGDSVGGPKFVKSILGPTPWTRIMPTGGVEANEASITAWFKAGVAAVGIGSDLIRKEWVREGNFAAISELAAKCLSWVRTARGQNVFTGLEHVGVAPQADVTAMSVAEWYRDTFGFEIAEGNSSIFVRGSGSGRIEISKVEHGPQIHLAISVADFDAAVAALRGRGVELETPTIKAAIKSVYLKQPDPAGHRVHLLWRR
jgi:2-dehydro-3-deoxyphosphogluconate aldolase/(4S)-4-hydroxy-2-oxoglutarate aldolase